MLEATFGGCFSAQVDTNHVMSHTSSRIYTADRMKSLARRWIAGGVGRAAFGNVTGKYCSITWTLLRFFSSMEQASSKFHETWAGLTSIRGDCDGPFEIMEHMSTVIVSSNRSSPPSQFAFRYTLPNFAASTIRSNNLGILATILGPESPESSFGKRDT